MKNLIMKKLTKCCFQDCYLLPPIRATDINECMRKYMDGISQNLQSLSSYSTSFPPCFGDEGGSY